MLDETIEHALYLAFAISPDILKYHERPKQPEYQSPEHPTMGAYAEGNVLGSE